MAGESTLIVTTRTGVRPLGVRGEPLHNSAAPLRGAIRRRLGDDTANLLAEPQLRESGDGIDWYASQGGDVRRFSELSEAERQQALLRKGQAGGVARAIEHDGHDRNARLVEKRGERRRDARLHQHAQATGVRF